MIKYLAKKLILLNFILLSLITFGCSKEMRSERFYSDLKSADDLIENYTRDNALKALKKLRNRAETPAQFLSVAKREASLKENSEAIATLKYCLKNQYSVDVVAYLVYLLNSTAQYEEASYYASMLNNTKYSSLGAESLLKAESKELLDSDFYLSAFDATDDQAFLVNAALYFSKNGQLEKALELRNLFTDDGSEYPYFWGLLAFDLGEFSVVFDELDFSLINSDIFGMENDEISAMGRRHLLLAADAFFGLGKFEMASAKWQLYVDRFPENTPMVLYNLALTAPNGYERSQKLSECIEKFPYFYPAIARYTRDYVKFLNSENYDEVAGYLADKNFYSLEMEKNYFHTAKFNRPPRELLEYAISNPNADPRFELELFKYEHNTKTNIKKDTARMWQILEKHPNDTVTKNYAKWYFAKIRDFNTCFDLGKTDDIFQDSFYTALNASMTGDTATALENYEIAKKSDVLACASLVNYACTQALLNNFDTAIKAYSKALDVAKTDVEKSKIHYRIAELFFKLGSYTQAKSVLGYAIQLDKENYDAQILLTKIKQLN